MRMTALYMSEHSFIDMNTCINHNTEQINTKKLTFSTTHKECVTCRWTRSHSNWLWKVIQLVVQCYSTVKNVTQEPCDIPFIVTFDYVGVLFTTNCNFWILMHQVYIKISVNTVWSVCRLCAFRGLLKVAFHDVQCTGEFQFIGTLFPGHLNGKKCPNHPEFTPFPAESKMNSY